MPSHFPWIKIKGRKIDCKKKQQNKCPDNYETVLIISEFISNEFFSIKRGLKPTLMFAAGLVKCCRQTEHIPRTTKWPGSPQRPVEPFCPFSRLLQQQEPTGILTEFLFLNPDRSREQLCRKFLKFDVSRDLLIFMLASSCYA